MLDLLKFATANARREFGGSLVTETHWIDAEPERPGGRVPALCGARVDPDAFSTQPTCQACAQRMTEIEALAF